MGLTVEQQVQRFMEDSNRPYNVQLVVDNLQKYGIKKGQVQKALDNLVEKGKVSVKAFGKVNIYFAAQDGDKVMPQEELDRKRAEQRAAEDEYRKYTAEADDLSKELSALKSQKTLPEVEQEIADTAQEVAQLEEQLAKLKEEKPATMTKEEQARVQQEFSFYMAAWRKRRSIFRAVWDTISENMEGKMSDLYVEIGIESDEPEGSDFRAFEQLLTSAKRRRV
mmetsp:Transcript_27656/g.71759  ORF Transcript_27656/g.71759 Transcript_27656/m.71759 type:complete len:223 (-) Transcript_27656:353-1021(-)